jgi:ABC-2 type transport system permease protein
MSDAVVFAGLFGNRGHSSGLALTIILPLVAVVLIVRVVIFRGRRRKKSQDEVLRVKKGFGGGPNWLNGRVSLVAFREIRERWRSKIFRIGTIVVLVVVAAAVVIPVLIRGGQTQYRVGVVGALSSPVRATIVGVGSATGGKVTLVSEPSVSAGEAALRSGRLGVVIVDGRRLIVKQAVSSSDTSSEALFLREMSLEVSSERGLIAAGLSPLQAVALSNPKPLPIQALQAAPSDSTSRDTAVYGLILIFVLLTQYGTWILIGVVEEKSSRVVEVLLSAMRPVQLLAGKVIGIGVMALAQGTLLVVVALGLAEAVGSDLVKGTAPIEVLCVFFWLVLGYSFYSWVWAAAGSLAQRQEHVQTLAFPLQLPILFGYIVSLTSIGSTNPSALLKVLAYVPATAPFAMSTLVAMGRATWWEFTISALITVAATVVVIRVASLIYSRAVLRTGRRVRLSEVLSR